MFLSPFPSPFPLPFPSFPLPLLPPSCCSALSPLLPPFNVCLFRFLLLPRLLSLSRRISKAGNLSWTSSEMTRYCGPSRELVLRAIQFCNQPIVSVGRRRGHTAIWTTDGIEGLSDATWSCTRDEINGKATFLKATPGMWAEKAQNQAAQGPICLLRSACLPELGRTKSGSKPGVMSGFLKSIFLAHATSLRLLLPPILPTAVEECRGCIMGLPAYCSFIHSSVGRSPAKTNPVLKSYPLSDLLSESNDWGQ